MGPFGRIESFCQTARTATDADGLARLVAREVGRLGFDHYMYWLRFAPNGRRVRFFFGNYPQEWAERYDVERYEADDLVMHRLNATVVPFTWGEAMRFVRATAVQELVAQEAADAGLISGAAVPLAGPSAARAHLVVATSMGPAELQRLFEEHKHELYLIGLYTHERALELADVPVGSATIRLTGRELEVLKWVVRGKSNWEIGNILSVSETTVKDHVRNICGKFGVNTKMHAASMALWHGYTAL